MQIRIHTLAGVALALAVAGAAHASTIVAAANSGTTDLGEFSAGTYVITATGVAYLTPGDDFGIGPDGVPVAPVTSPGYPYFNPNGSVIADGRYGAGGSGIRIGGLMGSFIPVAPLGDNPTPLSNYFAMGYSTTVTHGGGHIYAQVNDTYYSNDHGGFEVSVAQAGVPEPAAWALMIAGFGAAGSMLRRRRAVT